MVAAATPPPTIAPLRPQRREFWTPARAIFISYLATISLGSLVLMLPACNTAPIGFLDALFTVTSAVCVTGLVVVDTAAHFTRAGQWVIVALIQMGGLGIMTFATWILMIGGQRPGLLYQSAASMSYGSARGVPVRRILLYVFLFTLAIEGTGACGYWLRWRGAMSGDEAAFNAIFHSVSAFANAGFSTLATGLTPYVGDWAVNLTTCALIVSGGLGFIVLSDILLWAASGGRKRLSLNSRVAISTSLWLILVGAALILAIEWGRALGTLPAGSRIQAALFQSVTARTAGFNTVEIGDLTAPVVFVIILLMIVGASPGSTGGGMKTTTLAILLALVRSHAYGRSAVELGERRIPHTDVARALATFSIYILTLLVGIFLLLVAEGWGGPAAEGQSRFMRLAFECASALGTVGLSMNSTTAGVCAASKLILIGLMIIGRLGPLAVALTLIGRVSTRQFQYPEESVTTG